jgi:hypothetical protein
MTSRTTQTVVHFSSDFRLPGFDAPQPAGDYRVDHDEELVESTSRLAWRRVGAFVRSPRRLRRSRWCRSIQRTLKPLSQRTLNNHDGTIPPCNPARRCKTSVFDWAVRPAEGRVPNVAHAWGCLPDHRNTASARQFVSIPRSP